MGCGTRDNPEIPAKLKSFKLPSHLNTVLGLSRQQTGQLASGLPWEPRKEPDQTDIHRMRSELC